MAKAIFRQENTAQYGDAKINVSYCLSLTHDKKAKVPYTKEQIMEVFKSMDRDGDGKLSKVELGEGFTKLGSNWSTTRAWLALWNADDNNDGFICINTELNKLVEYALKIGYTLN